MLYGKPEQVKPVTKDANRMVVALGVVEDPDYSIRQLDK